MDRWIDGGWTDSKHLSSITTDDRQIVSHDTICLAFLPDMPITQLNPLRDDAGQLVASI